MGFLVVRQPGHGRFPNSPFAGLVLIDHIQGIYILLIQQSRIGIVEQVVHAGFVFILCVQYAQVDLVVDIGLHLLLNGAHASLPHFSAGHVGPIGVRVAWSLDIAMDGVRVHGRVIALDLHDFLLVVFFDINRTDTRLGIVFGNRLIQVDWCNPRIRVGRRENAGFLFEPVRIGIVAAAVIIGARVNIIGPIIGATGLVGGSVSSMDTVHRRSRP